MNHCVLPLFSTPLYCTQLDISKCPSWDTVEWTEIGGHEMSKNNYFLDLPEWQDLKSQIRTHLQYFFYEELHASPDCGIKITTSLANRNYPGQGHPRHTHSNSVFSGCVYFENHPAPIKFLRGGYKQLRYDTVNHNFHNAEFWTINPEPGLLLIWPSDLDHEVESLVSTDAVRHSIAFNSWLVGNVCSSTTTPLVL